MDQLVLDMGEFGVPYLRKRRSRRQGSLFWVVVISLALFAVLSWYFYVPSTLYLYLVVVCFTAPAILGILVYRREPKPMAWRVALWIITAFVGVCVLRGWRPAPPTPLPTHDTFFFASLLTNAERILPHYTQSLLAFATDVGVERVYVSIYENDSHDKTPELLAKLRADLGRMGVRHTIVTTKLSHAERTAERIARLSTLRNRVMEPMERAPMRFSKVVWVNDVLFDADMVHALARTSGGVFDQACALDYFWLGFYDTWVMRDVQGQTVRPLFPYFRRGVDRQSVQEERPILVNSCWNGLTIFDARWWQVARYGGEVDGPVVSTLPVPPLFKNDGHDLPAMLPLQFRTCASCNVSESLLTSLDMHRLASPRRPRIYVNPAVRVAYNYPSYYLYNVIMRWYVVAPWRYVWETWMERRLFSWIANLGNRYDPCAPLLQKMWKKSGEGSK